MHEISLVRSLIDEIKKRGFQDVLSVHVEVGSLSCADPYRMQFCFDMVKEQAGMKEAELIVTRRDAEARCNRCGNEFSFENPGTPCQCGSYDYTVSSGEQILLTEIEVA